MTKKWLLIVLTIVIAFQSVAAIADTHQFHQTGTTHLEFDDHQHDGNDKDLDNTIDNSLTSTGNSYDCHHCCHCHGSTHLYISSLLNISVTPNFNKEIPELNSALHSLLLPPESPPPIV